MAWGHFFQVAFYKAVINAAKQQNMSYQFYTGCTAVVESPIITGLQEFLETEFPGLDVTIKHVAQAPDCYCVAFTVPNGHGIANMQHSAHWRKAGDPEAPMVACGAEVSCSMVDAKVHEFVEKVKH